MIDTKRLLDDLKRLLRRLEDDLRERSRTDDAMHDILQREYQAAREAGRTGEAFEVWREGMLTQAAVAWLLGCVFVRFMEDNGLVDEPLLSGSHERRQQAAERQMRYFRQHPTDSDRDYLYDVFRTVAQLPAVTTLFDAQHHPVWVYGISGDAAKELIGFWRQVVPETGELLHDFTDLTWNTRFLGDLYQDLSEDARKRYALLQTPWFERHRYTPTAELPDHWPDDYKRLVERRMALIEGDKSINLIEQPEYKRRWNLEPWDEQEKRALRNWLLDRLEGESYWPEPQVQATRTLADQAQRDADFMQIAECYRGHAGFDVHALVAELVDAESVPFLPILRHKPSGLRKRDIWEQTWAVQRREDAIDAEIATSLTRREDETEAQYQTRLTDAQRRRKQDEIGNIPPQPKYRSADFLNPTHWRLRGALDVPKERFISYPFCSRDADPALLIGWAGWDHLQQAQALAAWYTEGVEQEGWPPERLKPLLLGLAELVPWLKQWHNDVDPDYNERMGDFFDIFVQGQLQQHGLTRDDLNTWQPPAMSRRRGRRQQA